jgi:predicted ArsR family transcriptional regulator
MAEKITQKQIYQHIAEVMADDDMVVEFCEKKITQIDNRKKTVRKPNPEVQERRDNVQTYLAGIEGAATVKDIADALGYSSSQVSGAMRGLVNAGVVEVVEPEQKSKPKGYKIVDDVNAAESF